MQHAASNALPPPLETNAHAEATDMRESFGRIWKYVAETDDFVFRDCQHLRQRTLHDALQICTGLLERKAVYRRDVPLLRCDRIDRVIEGRGIRLARRPNLHPWIIMPLCHARSPAHFEEMAGS